MLSNSQLAHAQICQQLAECAFGTGLRGEEVDRIASQARQVIAESRRLLDTQSSHSGFGSLASDRSDRTLPSSVRPPVNSVNSAREAQSEEQERRRRQDREAERAALELEKRFDEDLRKQKLATRQAEALLSECQAELERRRGDTPAAGSRSPAEIREEAAQLRQAAKKAEESARQQASEQREVRQRLQQLIDAAKAEVSEAVQQRADAIKEKQASMRRQQKQLQKVQATCVELSQQIKEKKRLCEETDRQTKSAGVSITRSRREATEVAALASALQSRLDVEETETVETIETLESGEGSRCDTGATGSDNSLRKLEETALSAKVVGTQNRCRSLEQQALASASRAEELSALVELYQLRLSQPGDAGVAGDAGAPKELHAAQEEHAELKEAHRQALAQLNGQHLQKLVTSLTEPIRTSRTESTPSPSPAGLSEAAQKIVSCEAEHLRELCLVEQRVAEHELSQYEAFLAGPEAGKASSSVGTLQELQGRGKLRAARLIHDSLHQLGSRLEHVMQGEVAGLDLSGKIGPVLVERLNGSIRKGIEVAKEELQCRRSELSELTAQGEPGALGTQHAQLREMLDEARASCQGQTELCAQLRSSVAALEAEAAAQMQQREEELGRGAALRTRLEEALRAEAAMGMELCSKLEEECRELRVSAQGLELSSSHETQACELLREELNAKEEAAEQLAARVAGFEHADAELEQRRQGLQSRMAAVSKALDFKTAQAKKVHEEAQACCKARAQAVVATEAERMALHAALANLEAEKQASLSQERLLDRSPPSSTAQAAGVQ